MPKRFVHEIACRYSGELLTHESQARDDCCCAPPDTPVTRCERVTGSSRTPMTEEARRGPQRTDGRYDVLCGYPARFIVQANYTFTVRETSACARCLPVVVEQSGDEGGLIVVKPIRGRVAVKPKVDPHEQVRQLKGGVG